MRATLDRKKQAVALASLFDVRIRNSSKRKSARLGMSDRKLSPYIYIYTHTGVLSRAYTRRPNVTNVATLQLQTTKNGRRNI